MSNFDELVELLQEAGLTMQFGLRAQGHISTIEEMLKADATWGEIGKAIGWNPDTAERHWGLHLEDTNPVEGG